jgi:hypothetical protein
VYRVCPNCGGGFVPRPIRPSRNWRGGNFLGNDAASTTIKHRPVDPASHAQFATEVKRIPPHRDSTRCDASRIGT